MVCNLCQEEISVFYQFCYDNAHLSYTQDKYCHFCYKMLIQDGNLFETHGTMIYVFSVDNKDVDMSHFVARVF